jgi:hypothetical protein
VRNEFYQIMEKPQGNYKIAMMEKKYLEGKGMEGVLKIESAEEQSWLRVISDNQKANGLITSRLSNRGLLTSWLTG